MQTGINECTESRQNKPGPGDVPTPCCFTPGAQIATPGGPCSVENLVPGDKVLTRDNGVQEICWTSARGLTTDDLTRHPHLRPVRVAAGALGGSLPARDMMLSPNHRVLIETPRRITWFESDEVFVAAKHLTTRPGIKSHGVPWVTYLHIMCDAHQVVLSDGAWTETYQPVSGPVDGIGNAQRTEIEEIFPELATSRGLSAYHAARRTVTARDAMLLAQ